MHEINILHFYSIKKEGTYMPAYKRPAWSKWKHIQVILKQGDQMLKLKVAQIYPNLAQKDDSSF